MCPQLFLGGAAEQEGVCGGILCKQAGLKGARVELGGSCEGVQVCLCCCGWGGGCEGGGGAAGIHICEIPQLQGASTCPFAACQGKCASILQMCNKLR